MPLLLVIVQRSPRKFYLYFKQYSTKFIDSKNYCQDPRQAKSIIFIYTCEFEINPMLRGSIGGINV